MGLRIVQVDAFTDTPFAGNPAAVYVLPAPREAQLQTLPVQGVMVTSRATSAGFDFVSRYFAPRAGIPEDPVTGSAHCCLGPY